MFMRNTSRFKQGDDPYTIYVKTKQTTGKIEITKPSHPLAVGDIEPALEQYLSENPSSSIEYLHGDSPV